MVISPATENDSSTSAPAADNAAEHVTSATTQPEDKASGLSQQQQQQQQPLPPTTRPAVVPGAGALVPRMSPVYHIGSLPTLFESPHSSAEVRTLLPSQMVECKSRRLRR